MDTSAVITIVRACTEQQLRAISEATGLPVSTLSKIRYGVTTDPRASTIDALRTHFAEHGSPVPPVPVGDDAQPARAA